MGTQSYLKARGLLTTVLQFKVPKSCALAFLTQLCDLDPDPGIPGITSCHRSHFNTKGRFMLQGRSVFQEFWVYFYWCVTNLAAYNNTLSHRF